MTKKYFLGTAIKFSIITSISNPDSVSIMISNSNNTVVQDYVATTNVADKVYDYIYQTSTTQAEGEYAATVKIVYGVYTSIEKIVFTLEDK